MFASLTFASFRVEPQLAGDDAGVPGQHRARERFREHRVIHEAARAEASDEPRARRRGVRTFDLESSDQRQRPQRRPRRVRADAVPDDVDARVSARERRVRRRGRRQQRGFCALGGRDGGGVDAVFFRDDRVSRRAVASVHRPGASRVLHGRLVLFRRAHEQPPASPALPAARRPDDFVFRLRRLRRRPSPPPGRAPGRARPAAASAASHPRLAPSATRTRRRTRTRPRHTRAEKKARPLRRRREGGRRTSFARWLFVLGSLAPCARWRPTAPPGTASCPGRRLRGCEAPRRGAGGRTRARRDLLRIRSARRRRLRARRRPAATSRGFPETARRPRRRAPRPRARASRGLSPVSASAPVARCPRATRWRRRGGRRGRRNRRRRRRRLSLRRSSSFAPRRSPPRPPPRRPRA
eukprot:31285-Pelagococcus_subviridis.AAC.6